MYLMLLQRLLVPEYRWCGEVGRWEIHLSAKHSKTNINLGNS